MIFKILVICGTLTGTLCQQKCNNRLCNYEAECILKDNKPTCDCVGGEAFFNGELCSEQIDNCGNNPCMNDGICHNFLGHYGCECKDGYSGQNCTNTADIFKKLHFHYNRLAAVGVQQTFLLLAASLGEEQTVTEIYTDNYLIDGFTFNTKKGEMPALFKRSQNLIALAKRLALQHVEKMPFNEGYYRIIKGTFWEVGLQKITLHLSIPPDSMFRINNFPVLVYKPIGVECVPEVITPQCSNPLRSLQLDIAVFNIIRPIIRKRCFEDSFMNYRWSVRNYADTVTLHHFKDKSLDQLLKIPPYRMWFDYRDDYLQSYMIQADIEELDAADRGKLGRVVVRCYVFVETKPTAAYIIGGESRQVNVAKSFILDGSISRDYSMNPMEEQHLKFRWDCKSNDDENSHCRRNMGRDSRLGIPAGAFKLGEIYKFTLRVQSTVNIYSSSRVSQDITAISEDPLLIHIYCVRNCERKKFSAEKLVHLKANCLNCDMKTNPDFSWSVSDKFMATGHRFIFTVGGENEVTFQVDAMLRERTGKALKKLQKNEPPTKGECSVSPTLGVEFETRFRVVCQGFVDEEKPLAYVYSAGGITLERSSDDNLDLRMPFTSDGIEIAICDSLGACTQRRLSVTLSQIQIPSATDDFISYLVKNETNLVTLNTRGERLSAAVLMDAAIKRLPSEEAAEFLVEQSLMQFNIDTLLVMEQFFGNTKELFVGIGKLTNKKVKIFSKMFQKISEGFSTLIADGEIQELKRETNDRMSAQMVTILDKLAIVVEEYATVHNSEVVQDSEDNFSENFPDFEEFDPEIVVKLSNWLSTLTEFSNCMSFKGISSAYVHLPGEAPLVLEERDLSMEEFSLEKGNISLIPLETSITMSDGLLKELFIQLQSDELTFQAVTMEKNPYWWYPDQHPLNTGVLFFSAFTKKPSSKKPLLLKNSFEFSMKLQSNVAEEELQRVNGHVKSSQDMPIYETKVAANGVLVVRFEKLTNDIHLLLLMEKRPRSFMIGKESQLVRGRLANQTYLLGNSNARNLIGFIALTVAAPNSERTNFTFVMVTRLCVSWETFQHEVIPSTSPHWSSAHCKPLIVGTNSSHIRCQCKHLSSFAGKIYPTAAQLLPRRGDLYEQVPINWTMVLLYISVLALFTLLFLRMALKRSKYLSAEIIADPGANSSQYSRLYLITIHTAAHVYSGTTANIKIQLHGILGHSMETIIFSEPESFIFQRSSSNSFLLRSNSNLGTLKEVSLFHDGTGRYPSWFCHAIEVQDQMKRHKYIFLVEQWITKKTFYAKLTTRDEILSKRRIFKKALERFFLNWFNFQGVLGPWCYLGRFDRFERTSIWIVKVTVTICGTALYFGRTTLENYEEEREQYNNLTLNIGEVFLLGASCHLVGVILHWTLELIVKIAVRAGVGERYEIIYGKSIKETD